MYAYNVRWHTTTDETPKEIHEIGLAEVKRIRSRDGRRHAVGRLQGQLRRVQDSSCAPSPQFFFKDAASLLSAYRDIAKRADPELAHLFGRLPQTPYGVKAVPDAVAPSQTTAYYDPGSFAAGRPGDMFANTYKLDSRPKWEMEALTLHEAVPGHHLQIALAQELQGLPEFRKNSSYTAFVEGWALYSESLGERDGLLHRIRIRSSASSPTRCGAPCGWSSTPACTRWAGRASRRSTSSARTPPRPIRTSPSKSIATSSGRARRSATRWAS